MTEGVRGHKHSFPAGDRGREVSIDLPLHTHMVPRIRGISTSPYSNGHDWIRVFKCDLKDRLLPSHSRTLAATSK